MRRRKPAQHTALARLAFGLPIVVQRTITDVR